MPTMFATALVNLYTNDIEAGLVFYRDLLGFDDVDAAFADLVAAGTPVIAEPHDTGNNNRNALLRDPDGNLVEIVAKRS